MINLSSKQQEFLDNANHRWNVKCGAVRSGKSYMDIVKVIPIRLYLGHGKPGLNVFLGNTQGTLRRNVLEPMQEIYGKLVGDITSDNTATIFGESVYCLGADKISQVNRIRGMSIKYCYGDEVVTFHPDVFTMLKSRLDKEYSKCDLTCNTDNPLHWFKQFLDSDADIYLQKYTIDDNPYLPEEFKRALKKEYAGTVWYDRYILGEWTIAEGAIYACFDDKRHVIKHTPKNFDKLWVACDYGAGNPTAFLLQGLRRGVYYTLREYYHDSRAKGEKPKADVQYSADMDKFLNENDDIVQGEDIPIIVDPSAKNFINQLRNDDFTVYKAKNDVLEGIRYVSSLMTTGRLYIHQSCKMTIGQIMGYVWDPKAQLRGEDAPLKKEDHSTDALRYGIFFHKEGREASGSFSADNI